MDAKRQPYFCDARLACFSRSLCFEVGRVPLPLGMRLRRGSYCENYLRDASAACFPLQMHRRCVSKELNP